MVELDLSTALYGIRHDHRDLGRKVEEGASFTHKFTPYHLETLVPLRHLLRVV